MTTLNFILQGFGFDNLHAFKVSAFGYLLSSKVINVAAIIAFVITMIETLFGFDWQFLAAYVVSIIFEWGTGIGASLKKGEKHESRKLGRMLLKILVYSLLIIIPNTFSKHTQFPIVFNYEVDPFEWLYWIILIGIIWQLIVSILENLEVLEFKFAGVLLKIINKKFYQTLGLDEGNSIK